MFNAYITISASKTTQERFQPDHSGLGLTLAGVQTINSAASFDGGLLF